MKILLVQTSFLGDVILSTPVIENLRELYPAAELSVLTTPAARGLVEHHPAVKNTLVFDKRGTRSGVVGFLEMARELRSYNFDIVFSLHKSWRTALLLRFSGIPVRYGFSEASGRLFYSKTAPRKDLGHDVLRNLAIFRNISKEPAELSQELSITFPDAVERRAEEYLAALTGKELVGIAPGSVWATKRWTAEGFKKLSQMLNADGLGVVLIGGKADSELASGIARTLIGPNLNLVGKTSLVESAAVINRLKLLVTNDSSPLHLASAMKTPVVAIFCATVPEFGYRPWQVPNECVGLDELECRPCGRHGGKRCPTGTHACQLGVTPEMVFQAVRRVLNKKVQDVAG